MVWMLRRGTFREGSTKQSGSLCKVAHLLRFTVPHWHNRAVAKHWRQKRKMRVTTPILATSVDFPYSDHVDRCTDKR